MGIRFVLMVNKQGQTRLAQYYEYLTLEERRALEGEIVRKCLARNEQQCSFVEHRNYKIVYRRYASLFFLVGVDDDENELAILEFIHLLVETMDRHFGNVKKLQFPSNETEEAAISFKRKWDLNKIRTVQSGRPIPVILY
ncbi:AP-4 complex subunit sigma isoform B [Glycine soja]|uniref:AP-4 complex subunit sigma isoform B n=1 Tax=Glycine soja TaxID=3848 RepID=A0A445JVX4_GLYSO|nr:AP-4 complex subunit sigma isoform B [Glycine soja]